MVAPALQDDEFIKAWHAARGSPQTVSEATGMSVRVVYKRRKLLEKRGVFLNSNPRSGNAQAQYTAPLESFMRCRRFEIVDGIAVMFSDPHYLPDHCPVAHNALEIICARLKPQLVVLGGDAVDGDTISRYDPTRGHHKRFSVREELDCVKEHLDSLRKYTGKARLAWILGNHDVRLSRHIAVKAPELLDLPFTRLDDWFPQWPLSWTVAINEGTPGHTVIRHRNQAGMLHLQAQKAGVNYAHGHLHKLNVHRMPTFAGVRYSIDCGSLADPQSDGFDYAEGNVPHVQGFAVLTYRKGRLMPPELCEVVNGEAWFRGAPV